MAGQLVRVDIANYADQIIVRSGHVATIRAGVTVGRVEPRVLRLHIPRAAAIQLGLRVEERVFTRRTARGRQYLDRACNVCITLCGRSAVFNAVIEPSEDVLIIGRMVLSELDLVDDPVQKRLLPRDPNMIITEIE
jgi:hypothetical protein